MKRPARRYQIALLCTLLALGGFTIYAHRAWERTRREGSASREPGPVKAARAIKAVAMETALRNTVARAPAQSGGSFNLSQALVLGGGGTSSGGSHELTGLLGQPALGLSSGGGFSLRGGFLGGGSACPTITVNPATLPDGVVGSAFSQTFTATGSAGPFTFSYAGTVAGLSFMAASATLAGAPEQAGSFTFTATATESSCAGERNYTLNVGLLNLAATGGEGCVDLNWTHSGFGTPNGFKLYRATGSGGTYTLVQTAGSSASTYHDTAVTPGQQYFYKLTVVRSDLVESSFSNLAAATPSDAVPPVILHSPVSSPRPPGVAITVSASVADLNLQSVKLFFRTTGASNYTERAMTAGSSYSAAILAGEVAVPGVDYYIEARDQVSVTQAGQPANPYHITIVDRPFIDDLTPVSGAAAGGTAVTLTGRNFKPNLVVRFDSAIAAITSVSATQIVCTTPPHFPAVIDVQVLNAGGGSDTRVGGFTYTGTPATLTLPTTGGPQNVRVQIPVQAGNVQGLTAADLRLTFNSSILQAVSATTGTLTSGWSLQTNLLIPGEVRLALAGAGGPVSGAGTLAILGFDVPGAPSSATPLTLQSFTLNGGAIGATVTNGSFSVAPVYAISGTVRHWLTSAGLSNVQLALTGDHSHAATSNASGGYSVGNVLAGSYTLTPSKTEGAAGISALDASMALQHAAGIIPLLGNPLLAADVDGSGSVNSQDAFYILQYAVGLLGLPFPGAGRVWAFNPATRAYPNFNGDQALQDFAAVLLGDINGSFTGGNRPVMPATLATLSLPELSVPVGAEFPLLLALNLPQGQLLGAELQLTYDPAVVAVLAVESGNLVSDWLRAINLNTPGSIRVALAGSRSVTTSGALLRLRLRAHGTVGSTSLLNITHGQLNEGGIGTTLVPGRVTIRPRPVKADFDVDGKTDLAVWRGATGEWLILQSANGALQSTVWGTSNDPYHDLVAPGDYDGDGKTDIAVWRPSNGAWYIINSRDGARQMRQHGQAGDTPVPAAPR